MLCFLILAQRISTMVIGNHAAHLILVLSVFQSHSYGVVREFVGHGIGKEMHEDPQVPNYGKRGYGPLMKRGLCIAIEPMITLGDRQVIMEGDGWTVRTRDRKCAAHFEHTVAVGAGEADILSSFKFIEEVLGDKAI